jgi:hypothetical protein
VLQAHIKAYDLMKKRQAGDDVPTPEFKKPMWMILEFRLVTPNGCRVQSVPILSDEAAWHSPGRGGPSVERASAEYARHPGLSGVEADVRNDGNDGS